MRLPRNPMNWAVYRSPIVSATVIAGILAGCSEEMGRECFEITSVRGSILVGGRPVSGGYIEIHPDPGTRGNLRTGPIQPDGSFHLDRVPVGPVLIGLARLPISSVPGVQRPIDPRVFRITQDPIRRTIPAGGPAQLPPIDLINEAARLTRRPPTRRKKRSGRAGSRTLERRAPASGILANLSLESLDDASGNPPGALTIRVIYRDGKGVIHLDFPVDQLPQALNDLAGTVWIDVEDLDSAHNAEVEALLLETFRFHPLAIEDALKDVHVPRLDDWGTYLYLVVDTLDFHPETDELQLHELDLFIGANFLLTYHHEPIEVIDRHRGLIEREPEDRLKLGPSRLLHQILDQVVDAFLPAIEHLDDAINDAQDEVFNHATSRTLRRIFHIKSCALRLHRVVIPMREVLNRLARDSYSQIATDHRVYFRDIYDHLVRVHDIVESLRDLIGGALDTYLSIVSNRTNDIMKVLTLLNVMFLPMTFLAGFFGMNFFGETLMFTGPVLPKAALFWLTMTMMIMTPVGMWLLARLRGWF